MQERRKNKRTNMPSKLVIKRLDGESGKEVGIDIVDVSKTGIGFECTECANRITIRRIFLWCSVYRNAGDGFYEN